MAEYQPLTSNERAGIVETYYAAREKKTKAQQLPTLILVGGQPGAGKSSASRIGRADLRERGGYVHIDADRMRERIDLRGAVATSTQTQADAGALATGLRARAVAGRRNLVEEGTFRNPEGTAAFIENKKGEGYRVELLAVATPRAESLLGIFQRYEAQHALGARNPRFVPEKYHDEAIEGFAPNRAQNESRFDRIRVVSRDGETYFDSATGKQGASAADALRKAQRVSDARLVEVAHAWGEVKAHASRRGADADYLAAVDRQVGDIMDTQKMRIHMHALAQLGANFKLLDVDERFASHTDPELTKVAYFRGFHVKARQFRGLDPEYERFDAAMADTGKAKNLPEVAELANQTRERQHHERLGREQPDDDRSL